VNAASLAGLGAGRNPQPLNSTGDLIIPAAKKLDEAKPMAERVGQHRDLAVGGDVDVRLDFGARRNCARERGFDIVDDHVDMHGSPVTLVSAQVLAGAERTVRLLQEVEADRQTAEFRDPAPSRRVTVRPKACV
jgi:hypothetical protein